MNLLHLSPILRRQEAHIAAYSNRRCESVLSFTAGRRCRTRQTPTAWIRALDPTSYQSLPSQPRAKGTRPRASATPARPRSPSESSRRMSRTPPLRAAPTAEPRSLVRSRTGAYSCTVRVLGFISNNPCSSCVQNREFLRTSGPADTQRRGGGEPGQHQSYLRRPGGSDQLSAAWERRREDRSCGQSPKVGLHRCPVPHDPRG